MLYRPFGRAGTPVSLLGFGGMRFGDIENREKSVNVMLEAARAG
jgi:aryl-alcohol dehydrogenase-like predicted oxidoreductase